jgi:hypothetical protein
MAAYYNSNNFMYTSGHWFENGAAVPHAFFHKESIELLRVTDTNRSQTSVRSCTYMNFLNYKLLLILSE